MKVTEEIVGTKMHRECKMQVVPAAGTEVQLLQHFKFDRGRHSVRINITNLHINELYFTKTD